ncbi:hypothetical protein ILUMI_02833, partial [Ignelater luminosus]
MLAKNIILCFLTLFASIPAKYVSGNSVEYYQDLLQEFLNNASQWEQPTDSRRFFKLIDEHKEAIQYGHYDFIIVGVGVAGSVLANRLTESGKCKILALEAGGRENDFTDVPGFAPYLPRSDFNWGYKTIPQANACLGLQNKQCNYPRGKAVGGSSVINYVLYSRGNKEDFNRWGIRNEGWYYKNVLPYFKKTENSTLNFEDSGYHGHHGPLSVETANYYTDITKRFLKSAKQRGYKILDYNGKDEIGYSRLQLMTKRGSRCSANKAFANPAKNRENLELLDHSLGIKILIKDKKAYGVEFIRNRKKYKAIASKEVIICGGTINSPQILMLSGIGPKEHLKELDISVVQDLPVGESLYDHPVYTGLLFSTNISTQNEPSMEENIKHYLEGYGVLTVVASNTAVGFESTQVQIKNPQFEYIVSSGQVEAATPFFIDSMQMTEENWRAISKPLEGKYMWSVLPFLLHPKSIGTIKLKTRDPLDFPLLDCNFYGDENGEDIKDMLSAIKNVFRISETSAFQSIDSKYVSDPLPACKKYKHLSDDYWMCALKQLTYSSMHPVATCKMGPKGDKTAVVDNKLKVHGISGLRVADASIIPVTLAAHTTAASYMIGEKASDLIRKEHGDFRLPHSLQMHLKAFSDSLSKNDNDLKVYGVSGLRVADASVIPSSLSAHPTAVFRGCQGDKPIHPRNSKCNGHSPWLADEDPKSLSAGNWRTRENDFTDVPGFAPYLACSNFNWSSKTTPQVTSCLGFKNEQCNYPRGKAVGGSSVVNFLVYVRGNKQDFDKWGRRNPGWDYQSVLPYLQKIENSTLDFEDPGCHGHYGPVSVETAKYYSQITDIFLRSAQERRRNILDYNGKDQNGYFRFQIMTKKAKAKKACEVEFIRNGKKYKATTSKEVVICGGTINSPQIMMLSGIGPKQHLRELDISLVQDLPVVKSFHDHYTYPVLLFSTNISTQNEPPIQEHIKHYLEGYGVLTVASALTAVGFENLQ